MRKQKPVIKSIYDKHLEVHYNEWYIRFKEGNYIFFSGVKSGKKSDLINSGGRVLGVTSLAETIEDARRMVYQNIETISFNGAHWRKDIGR